MTAEVESYVRPLALPSPGEGPERGRGRSRSVTCPSADQRPPPYLRSGVVSAAGARIRGMHLLIRTLATLLLFVASLPLAAQWTDLGDMPQPARQGSSLRLTNARAIAVVTVLSPDVIRVRISPGREGRDHSYAVVNRNLGDAAASFLSDTTHSTITTATLRIDIRPAPFLIAFATRDGQSLDEDDPQRGTAISGSEVRVWTRPRDDEHVYGLCG